MPSPRSSSSRTSTRRLGRPRGPASGRPKGALLTHANCFWTNLSFDLATGVGGDDIVLQVLPQFHAGGWNVQVLLGWWKGAKIVLERSFDPARCLRLIEEKRITTM